MKLLFANNSRYRLWPRSPHRNLDISLADLLDQRPHLPSLEHLEIVGTSVSHEHPVKHEHVNLSDFYRLRKRTVPAISIRNVVFGNYGIGPIATLLMLLGFAVNELDPSCDFEYSVERLRHDPKDTTHEQPCTCDVYGYWNYAHPIHTRDFDALMDWLGIPLDEEKQQWDFGAYLKRAREKTKSLGECERLQPWS